MHTSISFTVKPQLSVVQTQGAQKLVKVGRLHYVVEHKARGEWKAYQVAEFPRNKASKFQKGDFSLADATSWAEMRSKILDPRSTFWMH